MEHIKYKMSKENIIRALECLSKPNSSPDDREKCYFMWKEPSCFNCYHEVAQNALSLIKELTEENERLQAEIDNGAEVCHNCHTEYADKIEQSKADTVRKMQERLLTELRSGNAIMDKSIRDIVNRIANEFMEGTICQVP